MIMETIYEIVPPRFFQFIVIAFFSLIIGLSQKTLHVVSLNFRMFLLLMPMTIRIYIYMVKCTIFSEIWENQIKNFGINIMISGVAIS